MNRTPTAWPVRRFLDPVASFLFVEPTEVVEVQRREGAPGFDAPRTTCPHRDELGRCSFEALVEDRCADDLVLDELARIVHGAGLPDESPPAESAGLKAISAGFPFGAASDEEILQRASFAYDARDAALQARRQERR